MKNRLKLYVFYCDTFTESKKKHEREKHPQSFTRPTLLLYLTDSQK